MALTQKRILVTGAAGFIGSNLCEYLLQKGNIVAGIDSFITGKPGNLASLSSHPSFTFIEGDLRNRELCQAAVNDIEIIFHQAAVGSVPRSIDNPLLTHDNNVNGFLNILLAAKEAGTRRFIYASSSSVYGDSKQLPKVEEELGEALSPYAVSKRVNELYARNFSRVYGIETIGLRYFNVFGKKQDPNGAYAAVIPKFIKQLLNGESPIINGDGLQTRDFTYVDNVLYANELAAGVTDPAALNTVYNVACGENITLNDLVTEIKAVIAGYGENVNGIDVKYGPARKGDVVHSKASIKKAQDLLGYKPLYDLHEGLKRTIKAYID